MISFSQFVTPSVEIVIPEYFPQDTSWTVDDIDLELNTDWTWYNDEYYCFGGTFNTSFENFTNHIDSITMDINNWCGGCFHIILYKTGQDPIYIVPPMYQSIQTIINPWIENPDSLIMWTNEGGIKIETIYYDIESVQIESNKEVESYIYPNPAFNYFKLEKIEKNSIVRVYNIAGTLLLESHISSCDSKIDISYLKIGIYIVDIENQKGKQYLKLLKSTK